MGGLSKNTLFNGNYITEDNYSIYENIKDIWMGDLPFKRGSEFPTKEMRERADIAKTNKYLYANSIEDVYKQLLLTLPEIDPIRGYRLREIVARLPYYKNIVEDWKSLICANMPKIYINDEYVQQLVDNSNIIDIINSEAVNIFLHGNSAYLLTEIDGKQVWNYIDEKNVIVYMNKDVPSIIETVVLFNIFKDEHGSSKCEFMIYRRNKTVEKRVFNYNNGRLGSEIEDLREISEISGMPISVNRHNISNKNMAYGMDTFRYWDSSICAILRTFQNLLRVGEVTSEVIRKVPSNALTKDDNSGITMFVNRGNIDYDENMEKYPDIEYVQANPEIINGMINLLEVNNKQIILDSGLSRVFFDLDKAGYNLSAKALEAMLFPTLLKAKGLRNNISQLLEEMILSLCDSVGIELKATDINIVWEDIIIDKDAFIDRIIKRKESGLITQEDALALAYDVKNSELTKILGLDDKPEKSSTDLYVDSDKANESNKPQDNNDDKMNISAENVSEGATSMKNEGDNINSDNVAWEFEKLVY